MAKKFYTDIDLNGNNLKNAGIENSQTNDILRIDSNGKIVPAALDLSNYIQAQADVTTFGGTIEAGKNYVLTNVSSLTVSSIVSGYLEANVFFTTASSIASTFLTLPSGTKIIGDMPTFEANKSYVMSVLKGVVVFGEIDNI